MGEPVSTTMTRATPMARPALLAPLLVLELGFVAGYLLAQQHIFGNSVTMWLDLDGEQSFSAWFSSTQLLVTAAVLAFSASRTLIGDRGARWCLRLLALAFLFLSVDETVSIHEAISASLRGRGSIFALGWMPIYAAGGLLALFLTRRQLIGLWRVNPQAAAMFAMGVALFIGGGLVMELVGFELNAYAAPWQIVLEEYAEMAGGSVMLCAVLSFRRSLAGPLRLDWG